MKRTFEIKKGMEIWLEPTGNLARYSCQPAKGEIVSIGRKYFYVCIPASPHWNNIKFDLENFQSHYDDNAGFIIYPSLETFKTEKMIAAKLRRIGSAVIYAQNLNRNPDRETVPSIESVNKIYQILQEEGLVPKWKEEFIYGG